MKKFFAMIAAVSALMFAACSDGNGSDEPDNPNGPDAPGVSGGSLSDVEVMKKLIIGKWCNTGYWNKVNGFTEYDKTGFPLMAGGEYRSHVGVGLNDRIRYLVFNEDGNAEEWLDDKCEERGVYRWSGNKVAYLGYGGPNPIRFESPDKMLIHWTHDGWEIEEFVRVED